MSATTLTKSVLVLHSAEQMFALVDRVEDYPRFLPWYGRTEIIARTETELKARIFMNYMGVHQSFATHNHNTPPHEIRMSLLEGPFKSLNGTWRFIPLGDDACKIEFTLNYELTGLLVRLLNPVFSSVTGKLVDAFVQEANHRYGV
ncbi:MAG: type II toxin-antitoxin system RatA family toxin [Alysiella sp.]|uniref:type II toxin-antitoxin system RatA family toxin n=1 Tax=Alysiella sp. TaxID=1872483 RepID=UPI0026DC2D35|nr:type II toxin-antitoxin system RatA family toxin [Alysiella sp.]MDO4434545.1 type II toxin-antitoxin system RatA family toxin [Alysiella sp.]